MGTRRLLVLSLAAIVMVCVFLSSKNTGAASTSRRLMSAPTSAFRKLLQFVLETSGSFTMSANDDGSISTSGSFTMSAPQAEFEEPKTVSAPQFKTTEIKTKQAAAEAPANGCKSDSDCHTGGDMGGYCKSNEDCHCTAPFFATTGTTCELSCTPTSKPTACCRDDRDCQKGGDNNAYCKSPKSNLHTTPGNGMCRCGVGYAGTTTCHKATETESQLHTRNEELEQLKQAMHVNGSLLYLCSLLAIGTLFWMMVRRRRAHNDVVVLERQYKSLMTSEHQI